MSSESLESNSQKEEKEQFKTVTQNWSDSIENVIKDIGETCKGYKWMNIFAAKKITTKYNYLMYLIILIGPASGVLSALTYNNSDTSHPIQLVVVITSFVTGVISAIIKYAKFEQKIVNHKNMAAKFASLESNIRRQLSLYRNERVNAGEYLEWVSVSFQDLFASAPLMPEVVYKKWIDFAKENNIVLPDEFANTMNIKVNNNTTQLEELNSIQITRPVDNLNTNQLLEYVSPSIPELNRFSDQAMKYEIRRLYNM
jgi:hypothetical protein